MDASPLYSDLLSDDGLTADEMIVSSFAAVPRTPERVLLAEILLAAAYDIHRYAGSKSVEGQRMYADAYAWIHAACPEPHGFAWICSAFGLDVQAVSAKLLVHGIKQTKHVVRANSRCGSSYAQAKRHKYVERLQRLRA